MEGKITIGLIKSLQRISRGTERKLLETITSRFFEQLADAASTAMDWAIETSGIAKRHGNGISIANWAIEKMHQGCVAGFIGDCRTNGEPLCNEDVDDINLTLAMLMEAERHPAKWRDLTAAEHDFINKCGGIIAE